MNNISQELNLIIKLFNSGEKQKALNKIEILLGSSEESIDLLMLHAKICIDLNDIYKANLSLSKILNSNPNNYEALKLIYINYLTIKKYDLARNYIDKLLIKEKNNYEILRDKAFLDYLNQNHKSCEKFINKAILINDKDVFGLNILGLIYIEKRETQKAIDLFKKAISINPNYVDSYNNLGKCFIDFEKLSQAYLYFKKAYKINQKSELPFINIANILSLKGKYNSAIKFLQKAKKINPENKIIDNNIAINKCKLKDLVWVEGYYNLLKNSTDIDYDFVLGYCYLLLHNYEFRKGFNLIDARLKSKSFILKNIYHSNISRKITNDKDLKKNDKLLIVKEQGVGDEILFSSLYNDIIRFSDNVKIECDKRLINIFNRSFKKNIFFEYGYFTSSKSKIQNFNKIIYAGTLTKYFRNNIKDFENKPYLISNKIINSKIYSKITKFNKTKKIGISWKSVVNIYGELKSLKLDNFYKLFTKNRTIINVQYGDISSEIEDLKKKNLNIYNFKDIDLFNDFDSLISILKNIDVFVTVSNSTAHFAGAIGVPTILICPNKSSTYYYWDYKNGKTPWYESVSVVKFENSIDNTMNLVNEMIDKL